MNREGNIQDWGDRQQMALLEMAKSAYKNLTNSIDLETSHVIICKRKQKITLDKGQQERGVVWETTTGAIRSLYTPGQLVGKCIRNFKVAFGALTKVTQTDPLGDVALHRLMVGLQQ